MRRSHHIEDPALPLLPTLLDPDTAAQEIAAHLPEIGRDIELRGVGIADVRYDPGLRVQVLYRLKVRDLETGLGGRPLLTVRTYAAGAAPTPFDETRRDRTDDTTGPTLRTAHVIVPDRRLELTAYPFDAELPTLPFALDPKTVARELTRLWRGRRSVVRDVQVTSLGYTPQNRAAVGYEILSEDATTRIPEMRRLIGKLHSKKTAERLFAGSWALWRASGDRSRLAPPVGHLPALHMTLQEHVRGERLGALAGEAVFTRRVRQTARALAALHDVDIPLATRRKPDEEARVVHRWSTVLMAIRPDLARRIGKLRDRLAATLESRVLLKGPVHADFHHTNVLVDADGITIIDLDEMAFGDPLLDVGRFIASLRIPALRAFGRLDALADAREEFLEEYLRLRPDDERRVRLFEAACLFTAAASAFRIQRATWSDEVELLIDEASAVFHSSHLRPGTRRTAREPDAFPVVADAGRWARDAVYMHALLLEPLRECYGAEHVEMRVRAGDEDDALARYDVKGRIDGGRWSARLTGIVLPGAGTGLLRRVETVRAALGGVPGAPVLPRPVAFLRQLGMAVFEMPAGERLSAALGTSAGRERIEQLARALAVLHGTSVCLDRSRPLHDDLKRFDRRLEHLHAARPELQPLAAELLAAVRTRRPGNDEPLAPVLSTVRPHQVLHENGRVGFTRVETLVLGSPLLDVADFIARLTLLEMRGETTVADAREHFLTAYGEATHTAAADTASIEAFALLRLACNQARSADAALAEGLLREAAAVLEAA